MTDRLADAKLCTNLEKLAVLLREINEPGRAALCELAAARISELSRPAAQSREGMRVTLENILKANDDFRAGMPDGWEGDPLQDACNAARANLSREDKLAP